jgi:hypothetical protein
VNQTSLAFVAALESYVASPEKETTLNVEHYAGELMNALPKLAAALDALNPQLESHQHELVREIEAYRQARAVVLDRLQRSVAFELPSESQATLEELVTQARENNKLISTAVEDFRNFLAKEFPFKESF